MAARVESMGGTTLQIMMPSTFSISRPAGTNRLRSRMPHSSDVCSCTVRRRHCEMSLRPSKAPMVMLLLPASRASSTNASCEDQGLSPVVFAHLEKARGVEADGDALDIVPWLVDHHAPARGVAGSVGEEIENFFNA